MSDHGRRGSFNNSSWEVLCLCKYFDLGRVGLIYSPFHLVILFMFTEYLCYS